MFLRRQGIQPDVIDNMHLFDVLLEIMTAVDPAYDPEQADTQSSRNSSRSGGQTISLKSGQSLRSALNEAGLS